MKTASAPSPASKRSTSSVRKKGSESMNGKSILNGNGEAKVSNGINNQGGFPPSVEAPPPSAPSAPAPSASAPPASFPDGAGGSDGDPTMPPSVLLSAKVWGIVSPPPVNSMKGHFVPKSLQKLNRHRRISVEVHRVLPLLAENSDPSSAGSLRASGGGLLSSIIGGAPLSGKKRAEQNAFEEVFIKIIVPATSKEAKAAKKAAKAARKKMKAVADGTAAALQATTRPLGESIYTTSDDFSTTDDHSALSYFDGGDDATSNSFDLTPTSEWKVKYSIKLADFQLTKRRKNTCVATAKYSDSHHTREIIFQTESDAIDFWEYIRHQKSLERDRKAKKLKASLDGIKLRPNENVDLLIEVASAQGLLAADFTSSDPFVIVKWGQKEIHRTDYVSKNLDPIWTVKTKSLFLFSVSASELFERDEGLTFIVMDFDKIGSDEVLGAVSVSPKQLYEASGERVEFDIHPLRSAAALRGKKKDESPNLGILAIRVRRATKSDKEFLNSYNKNEKPDLSTLAGDLTGSRSLANRDIDKAVTEALPKQEGGVGAIKSIIHKNKKVEKNGPNEGKKIYRIRPSPDPDRIKETEWMTNQQIQMEVFKESKHWFDVGTGELCRVFLEILACDGLPNLDQGGFLGNKTDAFVNVVYEDAVVKTDIIDDCLAPRWMPWAKRAFIFHMMHTSSQLFLGVFDFDSGALDDHDLIGRVSIDLSNLRADTEYLLTYDIYPSAKMSGRKSNGTLSIRLRLEVDDERKLLLSNLEPPPVIHVNTQKRKDFRTARYTCSGKYDFEKYSMKTISAYAEELMTYLEVLVYLEDAMINLLMWRGHFGVTLRLPGKPEEKKAKKEEENEEDKNNTPNGFGFPTEEKSWIMRNTHPVEILLPLHSINAFLCGITLVENPSLIPSFSCASIAWVLIAVMGWRRHHPSPWQKCKSFSEFCQILVLGHSLTPPLHIKRNENKEEAQLYQEKIETRIKEAEKDAERRRLKAIEEQEQLDKELEEIGETEVDISTKRGGLTPSIDPFKSILYPIQQYLGVACNCLRFVTNVVIWEECYFSFWLSAGSLALAIAFYFVPWAFLIRWTFRLIVWGVLGPWMKLVDIFYYSKIKPLTDDERKLQDEKEKKEREEATRERAREARINRENATKLRDMKIFLFGKYLINVPVLNFDRYRDVPKPISVARPYRPKPKTMAELAMEEAGMHRTRLPGQHLVGDMIPSIELDQTTDAPTGQPTAHPSLLARGSPGANIAKESSEVAMAKIVGVVIAAGAITWLVVPLLATATKLFSGKVLVLFGSS